MNTQQYKTTNNPNTRHTTRYTLIATILCMATTTTTAELIEARTINGRNNSPAAPSRGAAGIPLIRFNYPPVYPGDLTGATIASPPLRPNPRDVSNAIVAQTTNTPNKRHLSDFVWQWGQFLDHDLSLVNADPANGSAHITINDPTDPMGPAPMHFDRSNFITAPDPQLIFPHSRQQINEITSFIDASNVYGSDTTRANELRTFSNGRLDTSPGDLPSFNTAGLPNHGGPSPTMFLAGDIRANEQVGLTAMHTIFVREHNRLADRIAAQNPTATDEQIYQTARKIVGAQIQIITYNEFLPALLGEHAPDPTEFNYNQFLTPTITQSFAAALYRFGHSMVSPTLQLTNNDGSTAGTLSLRDSFFNPNFLADNPDNVDLLLKGMADQRAQELDIHIVDDLRNFLFGHPGAGGFDLATLNIQRGRDHGLPTVGLARFAYELPAISDIQDITSNTALQDQLTDLYGDNINDIDLWVVGLAEDHLTNASTGELVTAALVSQFTRLRDGDRFFYLNDPDLYDTDGLLNPDIAAITDLNTTTLAGIIQTNTSITTLQDNVFFVPEPATAVTLLIITPLLARPRKRP